MKKITTTLVAAMMVSGCGVLPRFPDKPVIPDKIDELQMPASSSILGANNVAVTDIVLPSEKGFFLLNEMDESDPLPNIQVSRFSVNNASVYDTAKALLAGTNIFFTMDEDLSEKSGTYAVNASGSLANVLERMCDSLGIYYSYKNGGFHFAGKKKFVFSVPPMGDDQVESMVKMVENLGGEKVYVDKFTGAIVFEASRRVYKSATAYLQYMRDTKLLIAYDVYLWEVNFTDEKRTAINWNNLAFAKSKLSLSGVTPSPAGITNGVDFGAIYSSGSSFSIDMLASFLQTQGNIKVLSQPRLTLISGTESEFEVGSTTEYVSKIGTTTSSGASISETTMETEEILSGIKMKLASNIDDDTVYSTIDLSITDLVRFNEYAVNDSSVKLPQTTNRALKTQVRSRAGDYILLAGINTDRDSNTVNGVPGLGKSLSLLSGSAAESQRGELVMVLHPRIVRFTRGEKNVVAEAEGSALESIKPELKKVEQSAAPKSSAPHEAIGKAAVENSRRAVITGKEERLPGINDKPVKTSSSVDKVVAEKMPPSKEASSAPAKADDGKVSSVASKVSAKAIQPAEGASLKVVKPVAVDSEKKDGVAEASSKDKKEPASAETFPADMSLNDALGDEETRRLLDEISKEIR